MPAVELVPAREDDSSPQENQAQAAPRPVTTATKCAKIAGRTRVA